MRYAVVLHPSGRIDFEELSKIEYLAKQTGKTYHRTILSLCHDATDAARAAAAMRKERRTSKDWKPASFALPTFGNN